MVNDIRVVKMINEPGQILSFLEENRDNFAMAILNNISFKSKKIPSCPECKKEFFLTVRNHTTLEEKLPNGNLKVALGCTNWTCANRDIENIICNYSKDLILEVAEKMATHWLKLNEKKKLKKK